MSTANEIRKLAKLHKQGAITDEEFAAKKAQLLGLSPQPPQVEPSYVHPQDQGQVTPKQSANYIESFKVFLSQWKTISRYQWPVTIFAVASASYILAPIDPDVIGIGMLLQFLSGTWALIIAFSSKPNLVYWPVPVIGFTLLFVGTLIAPSGPSSQSKDQTALSTTPTKSDAPQQRAAEKPLPGECALLAPDKAAIEAAIASGMTMSDVMAEAAKDIDAFIAKYSYAVKGIQCSGDRVINYGYSRGNFGGSAGQAQELHRLVQANKKARTITMIYSHGGANSKIVYDRTQGTLRRTNETAGMRMVESWTNVKDDFIRSSAVEGSFINNGTYRLTK